MSPNTSPVNDEVQLTPATNVQPDPTADVVTRLLAEGLISTADAARLISDKQGRAVSTCTIGRWADDGVRTGDGRVVRLEAIRLGGRLKTSAEAVHRFVCRQQTAVGV
ncbi:DUF1580 domain-containing protein [bacterium]|nr:DUF1580 domain-containing protein [bacterium]